VDNIPRLLKAFVIAGGVGLVGGTVLLVTLLVLRATGGGPGAVDPQASLALPPGGRIEQVVADGERWLLLGSDARGQQFLAVVDARSGRRLSLLWLQPDG
jgi:hypothetical protein